VSGEALAAARVFAAWSRIWSPLPADAERAEAWAALGLPDGYERHRTDFWSTFHSGSPTPTVPLLLHAALGLEGSAVREDWMRVITHLGLRWSDARLPPDQLGV
jgi:hypothetical protein